MQTYFIRAVAIICKLNMRRGRWENDLISLARALKVGETLTHREGSASASEFLHGFPVCLLPGREKHVTPVSDPVSGLSSGVSGDSSAGSAHQSQRARAHRRGRTHVHQQPGDPHQIPRLTVRPLASLSAHTHTCALFNGFLCTVFLRYRNTVLIIFRGVLFRTLGEMSLMIA